MPSFRFQSQDQSIVAAESFRSMAFPMDAVLLLWQLGASEDARLLRQAFGVQTQAMVQGGSATTTSKERTSSSCAY